MKNKALLLIFLCLVLASKCYANIHTPFTFKKSTDDKIEPPTREAYEGFSWELFKGAGLTLWVQENKNIKFTSDKNTIYIKNGKSKHPVIEIFDTKNGDINDLKAILKPKQDFTTSDQSWDNIENCTFKAQKGANTYTRYILVPQGKHYENMMKQGQQEPVPYTCGGYGVGNSGFRYFEIQSQNPNKIIFVEIGQEAPLFDENIHIK